MSAGIVHMSRFLFIGSSLLVVSFSINSICGDFDKPDFLNPNEDPVGFFRTNQKKLHRSYKETFGKEWSFGDAIDKREILDVDNTFYGWIVKFSNGYFAFDKNCGFLESSDVISPYLWNKKASYSHLYGSLGTWEGDIFYSLKGEKIFNTSDPLFSRGQTVDFHEITSTPSFNQFKVKNVWCPFSYFSSTFHYQFTSGENWQTLCMEQGNRVCMIAAVVDLLYTYKLSTKHDCAQGNNPSQLYDAIAAGVPTGSKGANALTFTIDVNKYLNKTNTGCYLNTDLNPAGPYLGNYHRHGDLLNGHTVLVIGSGFSVYWGAFPYLLGYRGDLGNELYR